MSGAILAEQLRFDPLWVRDHFAFIPPRKFENIDPNFFEAFTILMAVGAITSTPQLTASALSSVRAPDSPCTDRQHPHLAGRAAVVIRNRCRKPRCRIGDSRPKRCPARRASHQDGCDPCGQYGPRTQPRGVGSSRWSSSEPKSSPPVARQLMSSGLFGSAETPHGALTWQRLTSGDMRWQARSPCKPSGADVTCGTAEMIMCRLSGAT
jgi:hypothetical protein